jgi:hypothetical protein
MTTTPNLQSRWESLGSTLPNADSIEENAQDLGLVDGTDEFYAECIAQAQS